MPQQWVDPEEFLEHKGVTVYNVYRNDNYDAPRTYWFTLNPFGSDDDAHGEQGVFDCRQLPGGETLESYASYSDEEEAAIEAVIIEAIDAGYFADWTWDGKGEY